MSDEQTIRELLADVYTPEGVDIWLYGRNRNLDGGRPIELIRSGGAYLVLAEVERLAG